MQYFYYEEVLSPFKGLHTNLPFNFILYDLDDEQDVENYLALLEDAARYIAVDVLRFEQEKAARGTFMNDDALDMILGQLQDFADAEDTCFLFATFPDQIEGLALAADVEAGYIARNEAAVRGLLAAYRTLYDGLEALRGSATTSGALCEYGEEGLSFFAQGVKHASCSALAPQEAFDLLESQIGMELKNYISALNKDPSIGEQYGELELSVGTSAENLASLGALMADYYPELPAHSVRFIDVPEELESQFSPAAYLVPPVDDASDNTIIINLKSMEEDLRLLDTIAHEGYPGHMYHYVYLRGLRQKTGWYRQSMSLTGYYESWSQTAESFFDAYNTDFSNGYCTVMSAETRIYNILIPAAVSIGVNYMGWQEADVAEYVSQYLIKEVAEQMAPVYCGLAQQDPLYYLEYALGYAQLQHEMHDAQTELGDKFDLLAFNTAFLDIGPTYFNLIEPKLDAWVASQK